MAEATYRRRARTTEPIRQASSPWFPVASTIPMGPSKQGKGNVRAAVPAVSVVGLRLWRVARDGRGISGTVA
jgi:hypothetical protein